MFDLDSAIRTWRDTLAREGTLCGSHVDELEDHLRSTYQSFVDQGLSREHAFALAREGIGTPAELCAEFGKVDGVLWHRFLVAGWALFAVSFLLPVHRYGITLFDVDIGTGLVPGFEAFVLAIKGEAGVVGIVSALTNAVMAMTWWRVSAGGRMRIIVLAGMMTAATLLNLWWLSAVDTVGALRVGYYVWGMSFGLVATGLVMRARALLARARPMTYVTG